MQNNSSLSRRKFLGDVFLVSMLYPVASGAAQKDKIKTLGNKLKSWVDKQVKSIEEQTTPLEVTLLDDQGGTTNLSNFQAFYQIWKHPSTIPLPTEQGCYDNSLHIVLAKKAKGTMYMFNPTKLQIPFYKMQRLSLINYPLNTAFVTKEDMTSGSVNIKLKDGSGHIISWEPKGLILGGWGADYNLYYRELNPEGKVILSRGPKDLDGFTFWSVYNNKEFRQLRYFVGTQGNDTVFIESDNTRKITFK